MKAWQVLGPNNVGLWTVDLPDHDGYGYRLYPVPDEKTARLIAAAPVFREALERCQEVVTTPGQDPEALCGLVYEIAREAFIKAESGVGK